MVEIIYDMSLINSAKGVNRYILENNGVIPEDYVFKKHNIDSLRFVLSNEYYAYNLKTYEDIYKKVKIKLQRDKAHFDTIVEAEQKVKDSINQLKRAEIDSIRRVSGASIIKRTRIKSNELPNLLKSDDSSQVLNHQ